MKIINSIKRYLVKLRNSKEGMQQLWTHVEQRFADGKSNKVKVWSSIFQPSSIKFTWLNYFYRKTLIKMLDLSYGNNQRFFVLHTILKKWLLYPCIKLFHSIVSKYTVKHDKDIIQDPHNNHIRLFRLCFGDAVNDIWYRIAWPQWQHKQEMLHKSKRQWKFKTFRSLMNVCENSWSYKARMLARDVWVTEMLEDTADREWCNSFCSRLTHNMMKLYGVPEEYRKLVPLPDQVPAFVSKNHIDNDYFGKMSVWPKLNIKEGKRRK